MTEHPDPDPRRFNHERFRALNDPPAGPDYPPPPLPYEEAEADRFDAFMRAGRGAHREPARGFRAWLRGRAAALLDALSDDYDGPEDDER